MTPEQVGWVWVAVLAVGSLAGLLAALRHERRHRMGGARRRDALNRSRKGSGS